MEIFGKKSKDMDAKNKRSKRYQLSGQAPWQYLVAAHLKKRV
jgi:hypothetical protein